MAVVHHPIASSNKEQNRCAFMFCMTWVGFFAFVGLITWIGSSL
jgi:hypothetical protein